VEFYALSFFFGQRGEQCSISVGYAFVAALVFNLRKKTRKTSSGLPPVLSFSIGACWVFMLFFGGPLPTTI
jgi:hypothetical protein